MDGFLKQFLKKYRKESFEQFLKKIMEDFIKAYEGVRIKGVQVTKTTFE